MFKLYNSRCYYTEFVYRCKLISLIYFLLAIIHAFLSIIKAFQISGYLWQKSKYGILSQKCILLKLFPLHGKPQSFRGLNFQSCDNGRTMVCCAVAVIMDVLNSLCALKIDLA